MIVALGAIGVVGVVAVTKTGSPARKPPLRIAVVMDAGGPEARGLNRLAAKGLDEAEKSLAVEGDAFVSRTASDYRSTLSTAAEQGYGLVIANGVAMSGALAAVAARFPATRFAIVGVPREVYAGWPPNIRGLVFDEQEVGYLAGAAAALVSRTHRVGSVVGRDMPGRPAFQAGFRAGARRTVAGTKVRTDTSSTLPGLSSCRAAALRQIAGGSDIVAADGRDCGKGAFEAAHQKKRWGIGVDTDQSFRGRYVLTSVVKQVDVAVYRAIASVVEGGSARGDLAFTVGNGGIGLGAVSSGAPPTLAARLTSILTAMKAGKLAPPQR